MEDSPMYGGFTQQNDIVCSLFQLLYFVPGYSPNNDYEQTSLISWEKLASLERVFPVTTKSVYICGDSSMRESQVGYLNNHNRACIAAHTATVQQYLTCQATVEAIIICKGSLRSYILRKLYKYHGKHWPWKNNIVWQLEKKAKISGWPQEPRGEG